MRIKTPYCPKCGKFARGFIQHQYGVACFAADSLDDDGEVEVTGWTDWDNEEKFSAVRGKHQDYMLECENAHWWEDGTGSKNGRAGSYGTMFETEPEPEEKEDYSDILPDASAD